MEWIKYIWVSFDFQKKYRLMEAVCQLLIYAA